MDTLHRETTMIDDTRSIYPPGEINVSEGNQDARLTVIGELAIPGEQDSESHHAAILKASHSDGRFNYMLIGLTPKPDGSYTRAEGAKPIVIKQNGAGLLIGRQANSASHREGDSRLIGSEQLWPGSKYSTAVSGQHLSLKVVEGQLTLTDTSTNGTRINAFKKTEDQRQDEYSTDIIPDLDDNVAHHTVAGINLAHEKGLMHEGLYAGHQVIDRDTTEFEGGVDIRSWSAESEAIVVDSEQDPEPYNFLRARFDVFVRRRELQTKQPATELELLQAVKDAVAEAMDYDLPYTETVSQQVRAEDPKYRLINLSSYLADGKGICRHMGLAAGWLAEKLTQEGRLSGRSTVEVNQRQANPETGKKASAHEYMRYEAPDGEIYVIDPTRSSEAKRSVPTLAETIDQNDWNYFRPGEKRPYMQAHVARKLGKTARPNDVLIDRLPDWVNKH